MTFGSIIPRTAAGRKPPQGVPNVVDLGVQNIFQPEPKAIQSINVSGFFGFGNNPRARFVRNGFSWADDLKWVKGPHNLAFGAYLERSRVDVVNQFRQPGAFTFRGGNTGYALADFLLGKLRSFQQGFGEFYNARNTFTGLYVQDNFRVTRRLTLNLGLRYEPALPWREVQGRIEQFRPDAFYQGEKSRVFVNAPPGLFYPGDPGFPDNGARSDWNNFAPRAGFAYDLFGNGKTSLRGGGGVFFDSRLSGISNIEFTDTTPFSPQLLLTNPAGPFSNPLLGIPNPFPAPFPPPKDAVFPAPAYAVTYDPSDKLVTPINYNWNLTIEHQLSRNWLARVAYVGSHGSHLRKVVYLNPAVYIPGSTLDPDNRRLFPGYTDILMATRTGNSSYNSLQVSLERRFSRLTVLANYTFSKSLDNLQPDANVGDISGDAPSALPWYFPNSHSLDTGPSVQDRAHRFVASYVWQLGQLKKSNRWIRGFLGDWEVTGILSAQSGGPLTILAGEDQSQTALGADRVVIVGKPYGHGTCMNLAPCVDYLAPDSFQLPPVGTFGNLGKGRLRGPGFFNWDMGFFKNFSASERWKVQLRAEFFNIFNRVNLDNPVNSFSDGGFGGILSAADPRIGQLALKITF